MPEPKFNTQTDATLLAIEGIGAPQGRIHAVDARNDTLFDDWQPVSGYRTALKLLLDMLETHVLGSRLRAMGYRIAHGGAKFKKPVPLTEHIENELKTLVPLSPVRQPNSIAAIIAARTIRPDLVHVACFDTAFHQKRPELATLTGLRGEDHDPGLRRYGNHGLVFEQAVDTLYRNGVHVSRERIIMVHLGADASMCALKYGTSVETATDFSSLAGLRMGIFCGDLERRTILYLLSRKGSKTTQIMRLLSEADEVPDTLTLAHETNTLLDRFNDPSVIKAVELFCYQARRHLVSLTAALSGLDRLVFTGAVGVDAPLLRARICAGLEYLGILIDTTRNTNGSQMISPPVGNVSVEVIKADELVTIARHVRGILRTQSGPKHCVT